MDYDFSGLCADQLEKLAKRLSSLNKAFTKEYVLGLNVINDSGLNDRRSQIMNEINEIFLSQISRCEIFYTEALNKIQRAIAGKD